MEDVSLLFDSHAHLLDKSYSTDWEVLTSKMNGVICVYSPSEDSNQFNKILAKQNIWGIAGIHPHEAKDAQSHLGELEAIFSNKKVVALGEIGMDLYYEFSQRAVQEQVFLKQLEIARMKKIPVVIHMRDSFDLVMDILKEYSDLKIIIHSFTGGINEAKTCVKRTYLVAINGIVTFKKADHLQEAVKWIPEDNIIVETDCPYLAPVPFRGKLNMPEYVGYTVDFISEIKNTDPIEFAKKIVSNTKYFFNI